MQLSLTPAIVELANRSSAFAQRIEAVDTRSDALATRISRLGRDHSGSTVLPADDPRVVGIRREMALVADEVDAAVRDSGLPASSDVDVYADVAGGIRASVRRMERSREVNVDGLARSYGRSTGALSYANATSLAESLQRAVSLLRQPDGSLRQVDGADVDSMASELDRLHGRWEHLHAGVADAYAAAQQLVDRGDRNDYRDDVLYTADLAEKIRPMLDRVAGGMGRVVAETLPTLARQSQAGPVAAELAAQAAGIVAMIDAAVADGSHAVDANVFLLDVERLRWDTDDRGDAPSSIAEREAWVLRNAGELAPQLPA